MQQQKRFTRTLVVLAFIRRHIVSNQNDAELLCGKQLRLYTVSHRHTHTHTQTDIIKIISYLHTHNLQSNNNIIRETKYSMYYLCAAGGVDALNETGQVSQQLAKLKQLSGLYAHIHTDTYIRTDTHTHTYTHTHTQGERETDTQKERSKTREMKCTTSC